MLTPTVESKLAMFINEAERKGNYPPNTADSMRSVARRLISPVLTDSESGSMDTLLAHSAAIVQRICNNKNNRDKWSDGSLRTNRTRIATLLSDYGEHGRTPQAMAAWKRTPRIIKTRRNVEKKEHAIESGAESRGSQESRQSMYSIEIPLRPDMKAVLLLPPDLSEIEAKKVKTFVDSCVTRQ